VAELYDPGLDLDSNEQPLPHCLALSLAKGGRALSASGLHSLS
jgi:hypothetical protein